MEIKTVYGFLLVLVVTIFAPAAAQAQSELTATIDVPESSQYAVGDPIELTLTVTHPADYQVIFPNLEEGWAEFTVMSQSAPISAENSDGSESTTQIIDARLFAPGDYETPPLSVTVADGAGELIEVTVPSASVAIQSILIEGDSELRDIKPQAELPYLNIVPWAAAGAVLLFVALTAILVWRRKRQRSALAEIDNRLPHEIALDELTRIKDLNLPQQGRFKEYYTEVSETIRTYMGRTFQFPVLERTTAEIQGRLADTSVTPPVAKEFLTILEDSDLVKFSKFNPTVADAMQCLARAYYIVKETKPELPVQDPPSPNGRHSIGESSLETQTANGTLGGGNIMQSEVNA